jgi:hypothetical protein
MGDLAHRRRRLPGAAMTAPHVGRRLMSPRMTGSLASSARPTSPTRKPVGRFPSTTALPTKWTRWVANWPSPSAIVQVAFDPGDGGAAVGAVAQLRAPCEAARGRAPTFVAGVQDMLGAALILRDEIDRVEEMTLDSLAIHERTGSVGFQARSLDVPANVLPARPDGSHARVAGG